MRKINDLVSGKPSNREGLWAMTNKQASGIGHTLSASACFSIFRLTKIMQSLLGFDFLINKHPGLHTLSAKTCQYITGLSNLYGMLQLLLWLCLRLRPPTDSCQEGQLSRYGVKFPLNAWHCLQQLELPFLSAQTCPVWSLGPCWRCSCLLHRMYICLYFLLVTGFYPVCLVTTVSWPMRSLPLIG